MRVMLDVYVHIYVCMYVYRLESREYKNLKVQAEQSYVMYVCVCMCAYVCVCVRIYIYIYIYVDWSQQSYASSA
jgi:hypothetical protein